MSVKIRYTLRIMHDPPRYHRPGCGIIRHHRNWNSGNRIILRNLIIPGRTVLGDHKFQSRISSRKLQEDIRKSLRILIPTHGCQLALRRQRLHVLLRWNGIVMDIKTSWSRCRRCGFIGCNTGGIGTVPHGIGGIIIHAKHVNRLPDGLKITVMHKIPIGDPRRRRKEFRIISAFKHGTKKHFIIE